MCLAVFLASERALPLIPWRDHGERPTESPTWPGEAQRLCIEPLLSDQEPIRAKFESPHVVFAGSYEHCSCGFDFEREELDGESGDEVRAAASRESLAELVRYVVEHRVREIYACWFGEEKEPHSSIASVAPSDLALPGRPFRDRQLCAVVHPPEPGGAPVSAP